MFFALLEATGFLCLVGVGLAAYKPLKERRTVLTDQETVRLVLFMVFGCLALGNTPEVARYELEGFPNGLLYLLQIVIFVVGAAAGLAIAHHHD